MIEHEISKQSIQNAKRHSVIGYQQGKAIAAIGKALQLDERMSLENAQWIEEIGNTIQALSQAAYLDAEELEETASAQAYSRCLKRHVEASRAHATAIKMYAEAIEKRVERTIAVLSFA